MGSVVHHLTSLSERNCPACGSDQFHHERIVGDHWTGADYTVVRCGSCGLLYLREAPAVDQIALHYENPAGEDMRQAPSRLFAALRGIAFAKEYRSLLAQLADGALIVDFGTGDGALASFLTSRGMTVRALDQYPSESWCYSQIEYHQVDLNRIDASQLKGATAVVMRHVLEHIHLPGEFFRILREQQISFVHVVVPNTGSFLARTLGSTWSHWDPPRHLQFFESDTLDRVAVGAGYQPRSRSDHGIDEVVNSYFRRRMLQWHKVGPGSQGVPPNATWWYQLCQPKGILATISSALLAFGATTVLSRLYHLDV